MLKVLAIQPLPFGLAALLDNGNAVPVNQIKGNLKVGCFIELEDEGKYVVVTKDVAPPSEECEH